MFASAGKPFLFKNTMFQLGDIVKTTAKISLYENMTYDSNGDIVKDSGDIFSELNAGEQVGIVEANFTGGKFVYVQLIKPVTVNLKKRYYALVLTDKLVKLSENTPTTQTLDYYAKCSETSVVNVRLSASLTGVIKTKLKNNSLIGKSDGTVTNNFIKFNLASGGVGFVHKDYATRTKAPLTAAVTKTGTVVKENPLTGQQQTVSQTTVSTAENWTVKDVAIKALISGIVIFFATKLLSKIKF